MTMDEAKSQEPIAIIGMGKPRSLSEPVFGMT